MAIEAMEIILFITGIILGFPVMTAAKNKGLLWLMAPLIAYSIPLFTIGPHPIILGLYFPLACYLLYVGQTVIRNPSAINEFWKNLGD
tara:strand:- start:463 stop:726 length:264 start_codon:yes stop_codon:yes gene_type:complete